MKRNLVPAARRIALHPLGAADLAVVRAVLRQDDRFRPSHLGPLLCALVTARTRRPWIAAARAAADAVPPGWHGATPPVFIVGFWRSGTTLLHELLAADRGFATPSLIDVLCPSDAPYLQSWKRRLIGAVAPPDRGVDQVDVGPSRPQEEEIALGQLGAPSFFAASYYPRRRDQTVEEALFFQDDSEPRRRWRAAYELFLRMLIVKYPGRRLLLKNPANSTRIPDLLDLYPDALFVRIDRPAEQVLPSFQRMTDAGARHFSLQGEVAPLGRDAADRFHARVMAKLDADWTRIAKERKARVYYDNLRNAPLRTLELLYERLDLARSPEAIRRQRSFWLSRARQRASWPADGAIGL